MAKKDFGTKTGTCEVCTINCWDSTGGEPAIWPCSLNGCPYVSKVEVLQIEHSGTSSGLALLQESGAG